MWKGRNVLDVMLPLTFSDIVLVLFNTVKTEISIQDVQVKKYL